MLLSFRGHEAVILKVKKGSYDCAIDNDEVFAVQAKDMKHAVKYVKNYIFTELD